MTMKEIETYCSYIQIRIHVLLLYYHNANNALYMLPLNLCHLICDQSITHQMYAYTPYELANNQQSLVHMRFNNKMMHQQPPAFA